jgi:hypothetical protein
VLERRLSMRSALQYGCAGRDVESLPVRPRVNTVTRA